MEGQELQRDDAEDALQTVHSMWQLDGLVGVLSHLRVVLATNDDGPTLMERASRAGPLTSGSRPSPFVTFIALRM